MPQNIEIKARLPDQQFFDETKSFLVSKTQTSGTVITQKDTFFLAPKGRLKLREEKTDQPANSLVFYQRTDEPGPKQSDFIKTEVLEAERMKEILSSAMGHRGEVRKERLLFMIGQTRVHLDTVAELGLFLELEVLMKPEQSKEEGIQIAEQIMAELKIEQSWLESGAYMDIIESQIKHTK